MEMEIGSWVDVTMGTTVVVLVVVEYIVVVVEK